MAESRGTISATELEVLKALWQDGPATVRELAAALRGQGRRWAYTTVQTLLKRLQDKGYVRSDTSGLAHIFRPAVSRERLLGQRLGDLADQLCDGTATPLVMALVNERVFSKEEIAQFRGLLDQLESEEAGPTTGDGE